jgi:uroporphyrinogen-III synthase
VTGRALVTRPQEDCDEIADALRRRDYEPVIEPMLSIRFLDGTAPPRDDYQGVLLTSANGARALARLVAWRDLPVWAVGEASAAEARRLGFVTVRAAGGDVAALARLVGQEVDPAGGKLLQVAASRLAGDLAGDLGSRGYKLDKAVLYEAEPARDFSPALTRLIGEGGLDLALFFSPRTAATFVTLAQSRLDPHALRATAALALSPAVAEALSGLPWYAVRVARTPSLPALVGLLDGE